MPLPDGKLGVNTDDNPLVKSPFIETWTGTGINPPPFGNDARVTNFGDNRITNVDFDLRITNT